MGGVGRMEIQQPRFIDLTWDKESGAFVFRLIEGKQYVTPKLRVSPLEFVQLMQCNGIRLADWVELRHRFRTLSITLLKGSKEGISWPDASWTEFFGLARQARGCEPHVGWSEEVEAQLEAERDTWGPA
jgi:hypothetical protein